MLETPLFGRFGTENRRLVFGPPLAYDMLVHACSVGGGGLLLIGLTQGFGIVEPPFGQAWSVGIGFLVLMAGVQAYLSLVRLTFDFKKGVYIRRQGPGLFLKVTHGAITNLDALVLIAEPNARLSVNSVTYHLVLHWKGQSEPLMVVQNDTRQLRPGEPLQAGGTQLLQKGVAYAKAMGIPFYDNSHFPSRCPVSLF